MRDSTGHEVDYNLGEPERDDDLLEETTITQSGAAAEHVALIRIDPASDSTAIALHTEALGLQHYAEHRVIQSIEDMAHATDDLALIGKLKKAIEGKRKEYVDPINAYLRKVNDAFKGLMAPLDQADTLTRKKVMDYRREEQRKVAEIAEINRLRLDAARREAALRNVAPVETADLAPIPIAPLSSRVHAETATLGTSVVWKWELVDVCKVPAEYLIVDAAKVGKVVRAGVREIPGIRIYSEDTLRVTGRQ